ncbi:PAS domain-containing sensor histidine kinase [Methylocella tundrae]|uniref:histidine kinase n=1 Tax=Methylocella tundrae TaxID=227605 RepID=A0A8B6M852_METTU|nr:ATP-binding protein [Methylocella tundrae]VTZ50242.1 PAS domain-containing sensor histidine kinase [Methylocella tundrae]
MGYPLSLEGRIASLIHPGALSSPDERARHENFILRRLSVSLAIVAAAPFYLASHGGPGLVDSLVFAWLTLPLAAVVLLSSTGRLMRAEALSTFGLIAAGLTAAIGGAGEGALAWLILAPLDSLFSFNLAVIGASGLVAALAVAGVAAADALGVCDAVSGLARPSLFLLPAIAYATLVALSFVRDQAARSHAEQRRAERFSILTETVGDLVVTHDRTGAATSVSPTCEGLFGLPPSELMSRGFFEHVHVADRPAFLKAIAEASAGGATVNATLRLRSSSVVDRGHYAEPVFVWLDMRARRCEADPGGRGAANGGGAIAIYRDITELKWREDELEAARARAVEANHSKDHFLANMSHELRTPLNAIIGFSEILGDAEQTPRDGAKQREYAAIIHQSGQHLLSVVNSILDLSKIQSGSFDLTPAHFSIAPLIDICCDMVKLKAAERNIEIKRACPDGLEEVIGDKRACKQILINLLSNAVKFTPDDGKVWISAKPEGNTLLILVADSGVGIDAQDLARLGNPFFQAKGALDRPYEGTGLGLSIVSGLVGLHGGSIVLASEPDEGTCVLVRLPMDCRSAADKARTCAKIETIARYRRGDEMGDLFQQITVKKIA